MKISELTPKQRNKMVEALTEWVRESVETSGIGIAYLLNTDNPLFASERFEELRTAVYQAGERVRDKLNTIASEGA